MSKVIGPFAECTFTPVHVPRMVSCCVNAVCVKFNTWTSTDFCPKCGHRTSQVDRGRLGSPVDTRKLREKMEERLIMPVLTDLAYPGMHFWLSNHSSFNRSFDIEDVNGCMEFDASDVWSAIETFMTFFSQELGMLRVIYGDENVQVKWGVICWAD